MENKAGWAALGFLCCFALLLSSCGNGNNNAMQQAPPPVAVTVQQVKEGSASYFDQYPGTVRALNEVQILPQVSGYITGIHFQDGQHVVKGQKLYSIDQQQYRGSYEQAVANLNVTKANLARAQQDADRYTELAKQDAIAKQTLDHALAELEASKMQVEAAKANVSAVATGLRYSQIQSPLTGTIGISQVKLGAAVSPGALVLNTVSSDNPLAVDFTVQERDISRFVQLQKKGNDPKDSTFSIVLPGGAIYSYHGHISVIDRAVDPQTGTIRVRLTFQNNDNLLKPGMSCTVRVLNSADSTILIPYKAVTEQLSEYFVYVVNDSSKVSQRKIVPGTQVGTDVIIRDGLQPGETIVVQGVQNLREGSQVMIDTTKR